MKFSKTQAQCQRSTRPSNTANIHQTIKYTIQRSMTSLFGTCHIFTIVPPLIVCYMSVIRSAIKVDVNVWD